MCAQTCGNKWPSWCLFTSWGIDPSFPIIHPFPFYAISLNVFRRFFINLCPSIHNYFKAIRLCCWSVDDDQFGFIYVICLSDCVLERLVRLCCFGSSKAFDVVDIVGETWCGRPPGPRMSDCRAPCMRRSVLFT